jgi:bifunctional DNA-binding transcriptional regulator/antitoxin component of YhaV-PrlF toxin-antitoxin module
MNETNYSRKLDVTGRIMIPIRLREQYNLEIGKDYTFSTLEYEGHNYLCIDCGEIPETGSMTLEEAIQFVQSHGIKIVTDDD